MIIAYPNLTGEIAKRGIKKSIMAERIGVSGRSLYNKMCGIAPFTWDEICIINNCFFPDMNKDELFCKVAGVAPNTAKQNPPDHQTS